VPSTSSSETENSEALLRVLGPPLRRQCSQVERVAQEVDGHFVALGEALEELFRDDAKIARQARELSAFVNDKEALVGAFQLFKKTTDLVDANLERTLEIGNQLDTVTQHLAQSREHESEFSELVLVFWVLVTSIRIEAAMLSDVERDEVVLLAISMERVHGELKRLVDVHFVRLDAIRALIVDICRQVGKVREASQRRVKLSQDEIRALLATFQSTLDDVSRYCDSTSSQSKHIRESFNHIIVSLQFQDIIRQKLEQVALTCDRILAPADEAQLELHLAFTHQVALVQQRQLVEVQRQLTETERSIIEHSSQLLTSSELALNETKELRAGLVAALSDSDTTAAFLAHVTELRGAISSTSEIAQVVTQAVARVRAQLLEQLVTMTKFTMELRRIALNAQLHAARVSTGTALEELSAQTRRNSDEMRATTDVMLNELRMVLSLLEQISVTLLDLLALSGREDATLCNEAEAVKSDLVQMAKSASSSFTVTQAEFTALRRKIKGAISEVEFDEATTGAVEQAQRFFGLLGRRTARLAQDVGVNAIVADWLQAVRLEYAMQDQRTVHDGATSAQNSAIDACAEPPTGALTDPVLAESNELGANVELF
jgi:hypothetical protein